jgi:molybdopterin-guanine dinucleotide biosynthesis protein A
MMADDMSTCKIFPVPGLYGLVMCGGKSSRMGSDKSLLLYYNEPQRYHVFQMLQLHCEKVFISSNEILENDTKNGYPVLTDLPDYMDIGPMAGLLTAFSRFPENDLLVIGCDHPYLFSNDLQSFLNSCHENTSAAFYHAAENLYEPLLAYYPKSKMQKIQEMFKEGNYSLQQFLQREHALKYKPENIKCLIGVNTKEDYMTAKAFINSN